MQQKLPAGGAPASNRAARRRMKKNAKAQATSAIQDPNAALIAEHLNAAEKLRNTGQLEQAEALCRKLTQMVPNSAAAHSATAVVLQEREDLTAALDFFKQAANLLPKDSGCWLRLGNCLGALQYRDAALIAFQKALELTPKDLQVLNAMGSNLQALERHDEALEAFSKARKLHPKSAMAHFKEGQQLQTLGDFKGARTFFEKAVELDPNLVEAHSKLAGMATQPNELEEAIGKLKALAAKHSVPPLGRANALFAAARVSQKQKQHSEAFDYYRQANNQLREKVNFNRDSLTNYVDESIRVFTSNAVDAQRDAALEAPGPIFIVGMPRSGTTLVEQILSSHPLVCAGGEEQKMSGLVNALVRETSGEVRYPHDLERIAPAGLKTVGEHYLAHMDRRFPDATRFTDKNPFNFFHVGLLSILFPNATIIHCQRDARDTCLSCYFQHFAEAKTMDFTTDLEDLGHFYNNYKRIMNHWDSVLPDRVVNVAYEDMVSDQESMSRMLIGRIGLDWDDACLKFNENERGVLTASQWQVRQPIYKTSLQRWRRYEAELAPLIQVLNEAA
ncbi:MAG: sulfotransferase [Hyphomicrobiales bacterium]